MFDITLTLISRNTVQVSHSSQEFNLVFISESMYDFQIIMKIILCMVPMLSPPNVNFFLYKFCILTYAQPVN